MPLFLLLLLRAISAPDPCTIFYGDRSADDEFFWAASELYLATGKPVYREQVKKHLPTAYKTPSWGNTTALGVFAWLQPGREYQGEDVELANAMKDLLLDYAAALAQASVLFAPYEEDYPGFSEASRQKYSGRFYRTITSLHEL